MQKYVMACFYDGDVRVYENYPELIGKLEKLKNLKDDKTVQYIKDIKMIDLS